MIGGRRQWVSRRKGGAGPLRYVPPAELDGRRHVLVDGAPREGTVLTLSHWPGTPTPPGLRADLSTETAVLARRRHQLPAGIDLVTVDHADEDATAAVAVLTIDRLSAPVAALLVEVARVGDFGVVRDRRAAKIAFALASVLDPARTPVAEVADGTRRGLDATGMLVGAALDLLPALLADPDSHPDLWAPELAAFDVAAAALADGRVLLTEEPALDLAVVRPGRGGWPEGAGWHDEPVHPAAVHSSTSCLRIAVIDDEGFAVRYRYESWVRMGRAPAHLRVDLTTLATELDAAELDAAGLGGAELDGAELDAAGSGGGGWRFDGAGALTPRLRWTGDVPSKLPPEEALDRLRRHLGRNAGSPAWDPYASTPRGRS